MVSDCRDSRIILGSHQVRKKLDVKLVRRGRTDSFHSSLVEQFRMHDSTGCTVYLETGSTPIIEGCQDLVFDRYPSIFSRDSKVRSNSSYPLYRSV